MKLFNLLFALLLVLTVACTTNSSDGDAQTSNEKSPLVKSLTAATFKQKVFELENQQQGLVFKGNKPCVIDFYATWCGPCKRLAPILDELALTYKGKVDFYKVDTDIEPNLSGMMGVQGMPSVYYIPTKGQPYKSEGLKSKEEMIEIIEQIIKESKANAVK